jgi:ribosomal-protein-alanine N-acetyltransferase
MKIIPMTAAHAAEIVTWRYPPPYDLYDMSDADAAILTSADGGFFALVDRTSSSASALSAPMGQVPGGSYDSAALGTGGGLRSALTRKRLGRTAVQIGLAFGRDRFAPGRLPGHRGHLQHPCAAD